MEPKMLCFLAAYLDSELQKFSRRALTTKIKHFFKKKLGPHVLSLIMDQSTLIGTEWDWPN
jgi:hypothetical protein